MRYLKSKRLACKRQEYSFIIKSNINMSIYVIMSRLYRKEKIQRLTYSIKLIFCQRNKSSNVSCFFFAVFIKFYSFFYQKI